MFAAFLCTILFSISVICGHKSVTRIGGVEANFWRLTVAGVLLGSWSFATGPGLESNTLPLFIISGIFGIGIGDTTFFQALPKLGSRLTLLLIECLSAPFGALIEWAWMGTTLTPRQIGYGLVILAGVALALKPGSRFKISRRDMNVGVAYCTAAALATAIGAVISRKAYAIEQGPSRAINAGNAAFYRVLGGLIIASLCVLAAKHKILRLQPTNTRGNLVAVSWAKWRGAGLWVFLNAFAGMTLGVTCMQMALQTIPAGLVLAIIAVTPIVVIPFAYIFEGERPTAASLIGGGVAVFGVIGLTVL